MKNRITRNVTLDRLESVQMEFKNLKVKDKSCSMLLTDKRLIIYTFGPERVQGRTVRRQIMNEIDLRSIHRFEYFYEFHNRSVVIRIFGLILFLVGVILAYVNFAGIIQTNFPLLAQYYYYTFGVAALLAILGLLTVFSTDKMLYLHIRSGADDKTDLIFFPNKENEACLRFIAGKLHNR